MKYIGMNNLAQYKCGSTPQVGDTVKSDSAYTCLLHLDTPYEVLSVNEDKSRIYIDILNFSGGLVYPTHWFSLISRKATSMKINVEAPIRSQTFFSYLVGGDWFKWDNNYYLKLHDPTSGTNAVRSDGVRCFFADTNVVTKVIDPVLTGRLES